jgi:hypothetical protein
MAERFIAVRKNQDGDIVQLKTTSGQIVDYKQAQVMAKKWGSRRCECFSGQGW